MDPPTSTIHPPCWLNPATTETPQPSQMGMDSMSCCTTRSVGLACACICLEHPSDAVWLSPIPQSHSGTMWATKPVRVMSPCHRLAEHQTLQPPYGLPGTRTARSILSHLETSHDPTPCRTHASKATALPGPCPGASLSHPGS